MVGNYCYISRNRTPPLDSFVNARCDGRCRRDATQMSQPYLSLDALPRDTTCRTGITFRHASHDDVTRESSEATPGTLSKNLRLNTCMSSGYLEAVQRGPHRYNICEIIDCGGCQRSPIAPLLSPSEETRLVRQV